MSSEITESEIEEIFPKVAAIIADALGCDDDEVTPKASLIN